MDLPALVAYCHRQPGNVPDTGAPLPGRYSREGEMAKVLTDVAIRNLKPGQTRREVPDGGARGLHVTV